MKLTDALKKALKNHPKIKLALNEFNLSFTDITIKELRQNVWYTIQEGVEEVIILIIDGKLKIVTDLKNKFQKKENKMELTTFTNNEFGAVRVLRDENNEPWFVANEICKVLGYTNPRKAIADHVDEEDKGVTICDTLGGKQKVTIINESGLYSLILKSKLPQAKKFKRWVTNEVLPSIRKYGGYLSPQKVEEALLNPDTIIKIAQKLKEEQEKRKSLENKVKELKPKANFAEIVSKSDDLILVRDFAKLISKDGFSIGERRLYDWLREQGYIMKNSKQPYQKYVDMGIFKVVEGTRTSSSGTFTYYTTKITGKGQVYLQKKIYEYFGVKQGA